MRPQEAFLLPGRARGVRGGGVKEFPSWVVYLSSGKSDKVRTFAWSQMD
jgi:hypothetical protein